MFAVEVQHSSVAARDGLWHSCGEGCGTMVEAIQLAKRLAGPTAYDRPTRVVHRGKTVYESRLVEAQE